MKTNGMRLATVATLLVLSAGTMLSQVPSSNAGLNYMGVIPIPNWTATGATQQATDLSSFNPVTQILYYADRVNHAVDAIDTKTNSFLGFVPVPNCVGSCPSGVLVVADLQKLVVTDRATSVYIYDLNLPGSHS
jgi:DNA-binding beta-propeller fold protein YncE